jgi:hypothetical protein
MATISIKNVYVEMLRTLGGVDSIVEEAVKKYLIDKCVERLEKAKSKIRGFEKLYDCPYSEFYSMISDETKVAQVEKKHPTWEADLAEWEYWQKEFVEWKQKLEDILTKS